MKLKKNLLCTFFSEIKISRWLIVLYTVIFSVMFTVLLSIISFAEHIPDSMEQKLNEKFGGNIYIANILSLTSKNAEILAEIPNIKEAHISFLGEAIVLDGAAISSDTAVLNDEGIINVCTTNSDDSNISEGRGIEFSDNTSDKYSLWLSKTSSERLNVKIGDILKFLTKNSGQYSVVLEGIYYDTYNEAAFMINAPLAETILKNAEKTIRQSCYAIFSSYYDCRNAITEFEKNGCEVNCSYYNQIDAIYDNVRYMQMILIIISLVMFVCLGIILYAMNSMIIDVRSGYIAMLKALGAKNGQIVRLYLAICEPVLALGILAGWLISRYYISYTSELMETYLDFSVSAASMIPSIVTILIAFLGANVVLTAVFAVMYRRISKVCAVALFNSSERDG